MKNRIITISREFGSGGRTIGKKVAEELGIPCYDNEIIQKIAKESGFDEQYIKETGEYASGGFFLLWQTELLARQMVIIFGKCNIKLSLSSLSKALA